MKQFENSWVLEGFDAHSSFYTKSMFGGLAVYIFDRLMFVLVEPSKSGRWQWHGVLLCTDFKYHESLTGEFPALSPHEVLKKWLYIDTSNEVFEDTMQSIVDKVLLNDHRMGVFPKLKKKS